MRKEKDFLGEVEIEDKYLYGIHSVRARQNFPNQSAFHQEWYQAVGEVKRACYQTYKNFKKLVLKGIPTTDLPIHFMGDSSIESLQKAAEEVALGKHFDHFIIPAVQGGAGTSINLNVNEIIANRALQIMNHQTGDYSTIDPIEQANIYQSTNDVIPTALKVSLMKLLKKLEEAINKSRKAMEGVENEFRSIPRLGYTQLQEAVPSTYGRLFSSYSDALSRDWWRVSKSWERIKVVNLGGGAIGTGVSVPRYFIMEVVQQLKDLTKLPISRGENLGDATSNLDSYVEVSAILKAHAVNLEKMANDMRLLASDITKPNFSIPQRQVGSSIMPGKVNPVIPEFIISSMHQVYCNDMLISNLSAKSDFELNAYLPSIGNALLENLKLLIAANQSLEQNLLHGIKIDTQNSEEDFYKSASLTTVLSPLIGYHKAAEMAKLMKQKQTSIFQANQELNLLGEEKLKEMMKPESLTALGFSIKDLM
ncbi:MULTISPECIES: lyase family protein [unclassified Lentimicrobium]|uniref:lyase family protein n=1 Tax=unclassified Lentimicrobium TaxID=2677434 RepID=UPI001551695A|nr:MULTISPECIES: lyase family protein [unclassified Lentimicrobium]NPD44603.1 aspartate ammonia-lyase [Lentimicrobium sp. S6]NPD83315.1 aspartate ammonia-lyase [Lentimicrobium sp. L6]